MLDGFATFVAVVGAGSFTQAAKADGVAVSSVTRRIDALEAELGVRLFARSPRRLTLTDAGEFLLPRARAILAELAEARDRLSALGAEPRGLLTVTAPTMFGRLHVAPAVRGFLERHPLVEVDLLLGDEVLDLRERRVDVAVRIGALPPSDLVATPLAPLHRLLCASPAYLARAGTPATPLDLLGHACLTVASAAPPPGWWSFAGVNREAPLRVQGPLRSDDTGVLLDAALAGLGIVHLASWLVGEAITAGRLVRLLAEAGPVGRTPPAIHAVRMPGRSHTAKARLFVAHLRHAFGSPPRWDRGLAPGG
jgi:DNA-binding transcriptional LysR family regulator